MDNPLPDLRHALRALGRAPGYTLWITLILALGIGANTAIFSLVNAFLIRPLPYPESERLVDVSSTVQRDELELRATSCPDFRDWQLRADVFDQMAAYYDTTLSLTGIGEAQRVEAELVTSGYWTVLGVKPSRGRVFDATVDQELDAHPVAVVSQGFWRQRLGGDPAAVGSDFYLNDRKFTVIGVAPPGFRGLDEDTEVWVPMSMLGVIVSKDFWDRRGARWFSVVARLAPRRSLSEASERMKAVAATLESDYPDSNTKYGARVVSMREARFGSMRTSLLLLLATVGVVLLIACANVANLALSRAAKQTRESAVRLALGASRFRLIRHFLVESMCLVGLGLGLSYVVALWCSEGLARRGGLQLPDSSPSLIDANVLLFNLGIGLVCALIVGLAPAVKACRTDINASLRDGGRTGSEGVSTKRLRSALVVSELTLALALLVGAGLMVRTLQNLEAIDIGFNPSGVASAVIELPSGRYNDSQRLQFSNQLLERLASIPGVDSAALSSDRPFGGSSSAAIVSPEGAEPPRDSTVPYGGGIRVYVHTVTPGFFRTLQVAFQQGRDFGGEDTSGGPLSAIVTRRAARRLWADGEALGKRFHFGAPGTDQPRWVTVTGVVDDTLVRRLVLDTQSGADDPDIYFPFSQIVRARMNLLVRSDLNPEVLTPLMREEVRRLDSDLPLFDISTLELDLARQTSDTRTSLALISTFAAVALFLACLGVYGVISYTVRERSHEIGVRMTLGASRLSVLRLVLGQGLRLATIGLVLGLVGALGLSRVMESLLHEVSPLDGTTYLVASMILLALAVAATLVPALRATRVDPIEVMRHE